MCVKSEESVKGKPQFKNKINKHGKIKMLKFILRFQFTNKINKHRKIYVHWLTLIRVYVKNNLNFLLIKFEKSFIKQLLKFTFNVHQKMWLIPERVTQKKIIFFE